MTKFEEELFNKVKVTNIELTTEAEYKKSTLINHFKNWHSDEEFQEMKESYWNQAESILSMLDEIKSLKSQLQQQALPVVPKDVDKAIKYLKNHNNSTFSDLGDILTNKGFKWLNDFQFKDRRFGVGGINNKLFILSHLAITGYEVEKPQLFKLIFPNSTVVLQKDGELNSFADTVYKRYLIKNAMTEQEIKSIDERYWQFAVPVEDGE
ncbi:DUF1642 domain-containing protein [Lactococcus lactis]|uniref:DUF1642 domain-containing protein n=1 Tax=Lactococcus lactis TaxID=1358 RepID=UPI000BF551EB|nr:DUF1642 domain-containing protein [Lactococcus lactis]PFG78700.1 hypothetical protein BW151_10210 [Lactococcus lactis]